LHRRHQVFSTSVDAVDKRAVTGCEVQNRTHSIRARAVSPEHGMLPLAACAAVKASQMGCAHRLLGRGDHRNVSKRGRNCGGEGR